jgi:hypothetical protein
MKIINLKQLQSLSNQNEIKSSETLTNVPFVNLLPKCQNVNKKPNEWKHNGCKIANPNNLYPCLSTGSKFKYDWTVTWVQYICV